MSLQHPANEKGLDDKAKILLFIIRGNIYAVYLYVFVICEDYMRKTYDMIWYDTALSFSRLINGLFFI